MIFFVCLKIGFLHSAKPQQVLHMINLWIPPWRGRRPICKFTASHGDVRIYQGFFLGTPKGITPLEKMDSISRLNTIGDNSFFSMFNQQKTRNTVKQQSGYGPDKVASGVWGYKQLLTTTPCSKISQKMVYKIH